MTRNLKALGLALVAVFAMSAVLASAAQAAEEFFHWDLGKENPHSVILTGEQDPSAPNQVFEPVPGSGIAFTCKTLKLEGTQGTKAQTTQEEQETAEGKKSYEAAYPDAPFEHTSPTLNKTMTSKSATVTPTYGGLGGPGTKCDFAGGTENAELKVNECHYQLTALTNANGHGNLHIVCPEGKVIEVIAAGATIKIGTQTPAGGINYTNIGTVTKEKDITVNATVSALKFTCAPKATCNAAGIGSEGEKATYNGRATIKGSEDLKETATGTYEEGVQVGIWKGPTE